MKNLSVIIPSKTDANLNMCVEAVCSCGENCRIIVVDDGLSQIPSGCTRIEGIKPFIFARNINLGIQAAGDDDVLLLNDDALLQTQHGFSLMQKAAEEHPNYGCIGATIKGVGHPLSNTIGIGLCPAFHFAFICVLIPRRTINLIGLLDEDYCIDYGLEDFDYCEAILLSGMMTGIHAGCLVDHGTLISTFRGNPTEPASHVGNYDYFKQKWGFIGPKAHFKRSPWPWKRIKCHE
jgi:glycosyltransferase involved in cell wall biosynthesis